MSAAERARLVGGLRGEIDRARAAEGGAVTKAAVQKILNRIGRPEEVVASANGGESPRPATPMPSSEAPAKDGGRDAGTRKAPRASEPGPAVPSLPTQRTETPTAAFGASSPHLASLDELGDEDSDPDWWRVDPSPFGTGPGGTNAVAAGEPVPGFVGGIELPEVLKPPPTDEDGNPQTPTAPGTPAAPQGTGQTPTAPGAAPAAEAAPVPAAAPGLGAALLLRRLLRGKGNGQGEGVSRRGGVVEWTAAVLLVAGSVMGSLIPLALGWLAAWWSPKLSRTEAKWAALGMPGVVVGGMAVWLWGRANDRWGEPLAQGSDALREAMSDAFPVLLRVAAIASALYLIWRARRPSQG
ncbi:hypothetical protein ACQEU8_34205 [Streptomyces sp. CA-250714]|uniref:hypothetical protein n=1 Tax=Streptomyces sp. CA-250714 TaxID=3240060 RepID=UPI003D944610